VGGGLDAEFLIPNRDCTIAYAAPGAFLAWLHRARADQVCIYARASMLSRREPIAATVHLVADGGVVTLWQSRPHAFFPFHYFARRTSKPIITTAPASRLAPGLTPDQARLLALLVEIADADERCPSNTEIGLRLGLSKAAIANLLAVLESRGLIRRLIARNFDRVVEIVETGARTRGFIVL
jgi:DNA-binding MarR family transcriptional regulator